MCSPSNLGTTVLGQEQHNDGFDVFVPLLVKPAFTLPTTWRVVYAPVKRAVREQRNSPEQNSFIPPWCGSYQVLTALDNSEGKFFPLSL